MQEINVCVQGKTYQYEKGTTFLHLAQAWQDQYEDAIILAVFNNKLIELGQVIPGEGDIAFLTTKDKNGRRAYRRSVVFLMQRALQQMYPDGTEILHVEHSLGAGYYCRMEGRKVIDSAWLENLKNACPGRKKSYDRKKDHEDRGCQKTFCQVRYAG